MGPVSELLTMLEWAVSSYTAVSVSSGDQSVFAHYWLENPTKVTLDYYAKLALSLSDLAANVVRVTSAGTVWNSVYQHTQCFVHANGGEAKKFGRKIVRDIRKHISTRCGKSRALLVD